jgi:PPIC-type PPIASE domain
MNLCKAWQACGLAAGLFLAEVLVGTAYGQTPPGQDSHHPSVAGTTSPANSSPDSVVIRVGKEEVTKSELEMALKSLAPQERQAMQSGGRRNLGEQYAMMVLLSQQAVNDHLDDSQDFVRRLALQRRQWLAEAEYTRLYNQTTATPDEVSKYYVAHPDLFMITQVRRIIVRTRPEGAKDTVQGLAPQEARTRIEAIRKALLAGTEPKKVAEQFQLPNVVFVDLEPSNIKRGDLNSDMEKAISKLKDGEISDVIEYPQAMAIFQLLGNRHQELKEVTTQIENIIRREKIQNAMADLKKKASIWIDDAYFASAPAPQPAAAPKASSSTPPAKP